MFSGSFVHTVDEKSRLAIPSKLRENLGDEFVVTKGPDGCLWVLPIEQWEKILQRAKESAAVQRFFLAAATKYDLSSRGRFLVPDVLRDYADIRPGEDVVFVGLGRRVEIWSTRRWEALSSQLTSEKLRQELPELFEI